MGYTKVWEEGEEEEIGHIGTGGEQKGEGEGGKSNIILQSFPAMTARVLSPFH